MKKLTEFSHEELITEINNRVRSKKVRLLQLVPCNNGGGLSNQSLDYYLGYTTNANLLKSLPPIHITKGESRLNFNNSPTERKTGRTECLKEHGHAN